MISKKPRGGSSAPRSGSRSPSTSSTSGRRSAPSSPRGRASGEDAPRKKSWGAPSEGRPSRGGFGSGRGGPRGTEGRAAEGGASGSRRPPRSEAPSAMGRGRPRPEARPSAPRERSPEARERPQPRLDKRRDEKPSSFLVWGRRPVESFLANLQSQEDFDAIGHTLHIIVDKAGKAPAQLRDIVTSAQGLGIKLKTHSNAEDTWPLSTAEDELNHQRVCLETPKFPTQDVADALQIVSEAKENGVVGCVGLILDQIQEPRNFGAIVRSAAFFGVSFVVFATDRQASLSPYVIRASAGGAFGVALCPTVNIGRVMEQIKEKGAWLVGTTLDATDSPADLPMDRPYVLVMGNEHKGLRQEIAKKCDWRVKIPGGNSFVDSLNVSVAAGILLATLSPEVEMEAEEGEFDEGDFEEGAE